MTNSEKKPCIKVFQIGVSAANSYLCTMLWSWNMLLALKWSVSNCDPNSVYIGFGLFLLSKLKPTLFAIIIWLTWIQRPSLSSHCMYELCLCRCKQFYDDFAFAQDVLHRAVHHIKAEKKVRCLQSTLCVLCAGMSAASIRYRLLFHSLSHFSFMDTRLLL